MLPICYTSDEVGAPTLNNVNGSVVGLLDAIAVNGFNLKPVTSITVAGNIATAIISGHGYAGGPGRLVLIAGATPAALNGAKQITVVDANTVTFPAPGVANGTASGTITAKRAPLGWSKLYSATNKAVYQRTDPAATAMLLRIDDTGSGVASTTYARALMVESATDVDTYTAPSPSAAQLSGGIYLAKGVSSTTAKSWVAVGDGRTLHLFTEDSSYPYSTYGHLIPFVFGDIATLRTAGDAYACVIGGGDSSNGASSVFLNNRINSAGMWIARGASMLGGSTLAGVVGRLDGSSLLGGAGPSFPSIVDGGTVIERTILVREQSSAYSNPYRGVMRGAAHPAGNVGRALHLFVAENVAGTSDKFLCIASGNQSTTGCIMFNITSEW